MAGGKIDSELFFALTTYFQQLGMDNCLRFEKKV